MKTSLLLSIPLLAPMLVFSQDQPPKTLYRIVRVQGKASEITMAACPHNIDCRPSDTMGAIVLMGHPEDVMSVEHTIQQLDALNPATTHDTSRKNIETTIYVIAASAEAIPEVQEIAGPDLTPVVKQLRAIFPYQHYQLLSSILLRSAQKSKAQVDGVMRNPVKISKIDALTSYHALYSDAEVTTESLTSTIHLQNFQFQVTVPTPSAGGNATPSTVSYRNAEVLISSSVDLREGQKIVVGKANVADNDTSFFIVLSARLVP